MLLLLLVSNLWAISQYDTPVSASDVNTAISFGFTATKVVLKNDGPNSVFVDFSDSVAATSDFEIKIGETLAISKDGSEAGFTQFGAICSAGQTAVVRTLAIEGF